MANRWTAEIAALAWRDATHHATNPTDRRADVFAEFGDPDTFDPTPGGMARWKCQTLKRGGHPWEEIVLKDEVVPHGEHADFLYAWYKIDIPNFLLIEVLKVSKSVSYDRLKKLLRVRCHKMGANVATAWIVMQIVSGRLGRWAPSQFQGVGRKVTPTMYKDAIASTAGEGGKARYDAYVAALKAFKNPGIGDECDYWVHMTPPRGKRKSMYKRGVPYALRSVLTESVLTEACLDERGLVVRRRPSRKQYNAVVRRRHQRRLAGRGTDSRRELDYLGYLDYLDYLRQ